MPRERITAVARYMVFQNSKVKIKKDEVLIIVLCVLASAAVLVFAFLPKKIDKQEAKQAVVPITYIASETTEIGKLAPDVEFSDSRGNRYSLSSFRGSPVVFIFFASWCGECLDQLLILDQIYKQNKTRDLKIVALHLKNTENRLRAEKFIKDYNLTFDFFDDDGEAFRIYADNQMILPLTFFIDKQGLIQNALYGEAEIEKIETAIAKIVEDNL